MDIQVDFRAESCTMSADNTLISARAIHGDVDVQLKMTLEQASDLDVQLRRAMLMVELKDV